MGSEPLLENLEFSLHEKERVALIGRNGCGKTTLFRMINGSDTEYDGLIDIKKSAILISTQQEFSPSQTKLSVVEYISSGLPRYSELKTIIDTYPNKMNSKMHLIHQYSDALEEFNRLDYFNVEQNTIQLLNDYQIPESMAYKPFKNLSGGQKRFAELVRVQLSKPDIALIDEPTNHMDFIAKSAFIKWLNEVDFGVIVISHDRDVLKQVDRIIELKDKKAFSYKGGYDEYLMQNTQKTSSDLQNFEIAQKTILNLKDRIEYAKAKAPGYRGGASKNPWIVLKERLEKQLVKVEAENPKPSFWIDQESSENLNPKISQSYHKYKAKNIKLAHNSLDEQKSELVKLESVSLGYTKPLFAPTSFSLGHFDRLHIIGRNGVGKTTLVRAIDSVYNNHQPKTLLAGQIKLNKKLRLSVYEQEISDNLLHLTLEQALEKTLESAKQAINSQEVKRLMSDYLFDPISDGRKKVSDLSGGQKARLQIIRMLSTKPNILILDEPTNHLDLPSIEELEQALTKYNGAIIYISHDSYFAKNIGGLELRLQALDA